MRIEIVDNDRQRAEGILLLLTRASDVGEGWQYIELPWEGWVYAGWVRVDNDGIAEGHTISVTDVRH